MTRRLATELRAPLRHLLPHVPVADLRANELDAVLGEQRGEGAVRHHRPDDDLWLKAAVPGEVPGGESEHQIAVVDVAACVHGDDAVAVAVEGEADVEAPLDHRPRQLVRPGGAAAGI